MAGAHVVGLARLAVGGQEAVGPHHVADVGVVAAGGEVTDGQDLATVALGSGDAAGQGRGHEPVGLAGTEVVEGPDPHHLEAVAQPGLEAEVVGRHLRRCVGGGGPQRALLGEGHLLGRGLAVDVRAGHGHHPPHAGGSRRGEHVQRPLGVDPEDLGGVVPGGAHVGPPGEVVDHLRGGVGHLGRHRVGVGDVGAPVAGVGGGDLVAGVGEVRHQVATHEAPGPRDQGPHRGRDGSRSGGAGCMAGERSGPAPAPIRARCATVGHGSAGGPPLPSPGPVLARETGARTGPRS